MKKRMLMLLLAALLCLPLWAGAEGAWLDDQAGLLTAAQAEALEARIGSLYEQYKMAYGIVTTDDFGGKTPEAYADDYFDYEGMGYGDNHDGMVFVVNMVSRDMHLSTHAKGISVLNDAEIARILADCGAQLANGEVEAAFNTYLDLAVRYTQDYLRSVDPSASETYGFEDDAGSLWLGAFLIALPVSLVIALVVLLIMLARHKRSLPMAPSGIAYVGEQGAKYTHEADIFLHTHTARTAIPKDSDGGGGTSTHTSSSGETHGGGGAKF